MSGLRGHSNRVAAGEWADAQIALRDSCAAQDRQAVRVVAAQATDADDCRELLAMLGLKAPGQG
ncbi:hypothetical protein ACFQ34_05955 [Pseudonocardia benzenivorans]|jgi:hypothetical protein|uniref:Uncharacterized protein n=2 Tax=Pseudonocardia TaxID=1847 RepID=F4CNM7_PSEUX|nr:hypothetical protein [Pseudonocardia dioxanivorans]AEA28325.1 hypothetical protein Psed_6224 [Pseudonocardia dioxanivorans CB1190]GJF05896.1 hypothetical protein PSD17_48440 [Pseudonocardia sp. D17]